LVKVANRLLSSRDNHSSIHQLSSGLLEPEEGVSVLDIPFWTQTGNESFSSEIMVHNYPWHLTFTRLQPDQTRSDWNSHNPLRHDSVGGEQLSQQ